MGSWSVQYECYALCSKILFHLSFDNSFSISMPSGIRPFFWEGICLLFLPVIMLLMLLWFDHICPIFSCCFIVKLRKEFSSEVDAALSALRGLSVDPSASHADLTQLFKVATHEAKKSRAQNRIFRVVSDQMTIMTSHYPHMFITLSNPTIPISVWNFIKEHLDCCILWDQLP